MTPTQIQNAIAVALNNDFLTAKQISENIDVNYKTCFNHLVKLRELNYIDKFDDKNYSLTELGRVHYKLFQQVEEIAENMKDVAHIAAEKLTPVFEKMETEMQTKLNIKTVEIVEHDAPIKYVPINEKTPEQIANHVNGTKTTPDYYKGKSLQVFDVLDEFLSPEAVSGFWVGNIIKYVLRYRGKNGKDDLLKARDYLDKLISSL